MVRCIFLLNDYDAGDEIERTLLPEANYEFPRRQDARPLGRNAAFGIETYQVLGKRTCRRGNMYYRLRSLHRTHRTRTRRFTTTFRFANPTPTNTPLHDGHDLFFVFYVNTNDFQPLLAQDYIMRKKVARGTTVAWYGTGNIVNLRTVQVGYDAAAGRAPA